MALFHVSISADKPRQVAAFVAQILGGEALPFPPFPDCWIAFTAEDDGTAIEVYPTTHTLVPGPDQIACDVGAADKGPTFAHIALASPMSADDIIDLAQDAGWTTRECDRGPFSCVEVWLENRVLIEVLDPKMQRQYRDGMTIAQWKSMFGMN